MAKPSQKTVRLLIIDDHALFRESLARLLHAESGFEVVAHCGTGAEGLRVVETEEIDVVLLDLDLGEEKGADFLERVRKAHFAGKVLLVTAGVNERDIPALVRKGISGVFLKHGSPASLVQGIRDTLEGKALFTQEMLRRGLEEDETPAEQAQVRFTERERQVLSYVFEGLANKEIADRLQISETAVKATLQQLFGKTGVRTRSQLVRVALESYRDQL